MCRLLGVGNMGGFGGVGGKVPRPYIKEDSPPLPLPLLLGARKDSAHSVYWKPLHKGNI